MIRFSGRGLAIALAALPLFAFGAAAQIAVSANDNKITLIDGVNTVPPNPAPDTVMVLDIGVAPPKVLGEVNAPSSVVGVPQSAMQFNPISLLLSEKKIAGGVPASRQETVQMLDFAARTGVRPLVETFPMPEINHAISRVRSGDVRFRAVVAAG